MISYIKGTVAFKGNDYIVIENHGIGYQIKVPSRVLDSMESGENVMLHTYLYVREDVLALFGFSSMQELDTFRFARYIRYWTQGSIICTFYDDSGRLILCGIQ